MKIVRMVKSLTAREWLARVPWLRKALWGGELWSSGFFISSVSKHGSETAISRLCGSRVGGCIGSWMGEGFRSRCLPIEYPEACLGDALFDAGGRKRDTTERND
ncbi:MAG: hypothetical protein HC933_09340 [Pleurocapsa sp. SU_196_0]|nr:hypothetical protein [Pleurocapsa sp. SU_196_0]